MSNSKAVRWSAAFWMTAAVAFAQGTQPKAKPADYPVNGESGTVGIGAEFLVHSYYGGGQMLFTSDYVVVEVALFPAPGETITVSAGSFALRLNGKKQVLGAQAPGIVAASLRFSSFNRPNLQASAGVGDTGVILGRPRPVERYPGDPSGRSRTPAPPRAPDPDNSGTQPAEQVKPEDALVSAALPEGETRWPVSGYLYFPFSGKTTKLKSVELLCGKTALKLR